MDESKKYNLLLNATLLLLKSHSKFSERENMRDNSYNNQSIGYKEEQNMIEVLDKVCPNFLDKIKELEKK